MNASGSQQPDQLHDAGVLTETTAELALALTFAAARRVVEGDKFMRAGLYEGWLPDLFVGAGLSSVLSRYSASVLGRGVSLQWCCWVCVLSCLYLATSEPHLPCRCQLVSDTSHCRTATGNLLQGKTVGIIGAGRIGTAYARMMVEVCVAATAGIPPSTPLRALHPHTRRGCSG